MSEDIEIKFQEFHKSNPDIYAEIVRIARRAKQNGKSKLSMRGVWEFIRFERTLRIVGDGIYELNNNFTPHYARLVREQEPDLASLFEIRVRSGGGGRNMIRKAYYDDDLFSMV
jgi:hypothetical protein